MAWDRKNIRDVDIYDVITEFKSDTVYVVRGLQYENGVRKLRLINIDTGHLSTRTLLDDVLVYNRRERQ